VLYDLEKHTLVKWTAVGSHQEGPGPGLRGNRVPRAGFQAEGTFLRLNDGAFPTLAEIGAARRGKTTHPQFSASDGAVVS
jgi:hypothetical protein